MRFLSTPLAGAWIIEPERRQDERGFFARTFCVNEFKAHGLNSNISQCNTSYNLHEGTLRGMHYQWPKPEAKLVRCTRGAIFDVIIDLRKESATYKSYFGIELSAENGKTLYVPEGFAHGFLTLEKNTEVFYQMSEFYFPENSLGVRYNDPVFGIGWPKEIKLLSEKDRDLADFPS